MMKVIIYNYYDISKIILDYENDLKHLLDIIGYYELLYNFNKIHFIEIRNKI